MIHEPSQRILGNVPHSAGGVISAGIRVLEAELAAKGRSVAAFPVWIQGAGVLWAEGIAWDEGDLQ